MRKLLCAAAMAAAAACEWPKILSPDLGAGLTAVQVTVEDQLGRPVGGVRVTFNDWTSSGSEFIVSSTTNPSGQATFAFASPGTRKCEIVPPSGMFAGASGLSQNVEVISKVTVRVRFQILR